MIVWDQRKGSGKYVIHRFVSAFWEICVVLNIYGIQNVGLWKSIVNFASFVFPTNIRTHPRGWTIIFFDLHRKMLSTLLQEKGIIFLWTKISLRLWSSLGTFEKTGDSLYLSWICGSNILLFKRAYRLQTRRTCQFQAESTLPPHQTGDNYHNSYSESK